MSSILINKLKQFQTFKLDITNKRVINLNSTYTVQFDDFFEISHLLDSSYIKYKVDNNLNIIILDKK